VESYPYPMNEGQRYINLNPYFPTSPDNASAVLGKTWKLHCSPVLYYCFARLRPVII